MSACEASRTAPILCLRSRNTRSCLRPINPRHPVVWTTGRSGILDYLELGFVPDDDGGPARTLAYAYNDWALAMVADRLGFDADRDELLRRQCWF